MGLNRGRIRDTNLHNAWLWNVVLAIRVAVAIIATLLWLGLPVVGSLSLKARSLKMKFTPRAICNLLLPDGVEDLIAGNVKSTFSACRRGKRAMALDHFAALDASDTLNIVDILSVVAQQLILILENSDELMRRRPFVGHWKNITCKLVKHAIHGQISWAGNHVCRVVLTSDRHQM
jgi:hypothetical protein